MESISSRTDPDALELLTVFAAPISAARQRLREGLTALCGEYSHFPGDAVAVETLLIRQLLPRLKNMASRTLILEMHVARLQGQLTGETSTARFQSFIERLSQPEIARAILDEYPLLERQALVCIDQWVRFSLEFLRHLCRDWPDLHKVFSLPADVGDLVELMGQTGDRHCDGKAVLVLRFDSGARLVYKPRSMQAEQRFQELLAWCNEHGACPPFRTLRVLERSDHGWVEFVKQQDCGAAGQIRRFYRRQGSYLALLYAIQATDFHFENLIAAGEHPILVDLETLFHERLPGSTNDPALKGMAHSAVSIGLLPRLSYFDGFDKGIDFSGLGAVNDQEIDFPIYRFESTGTDEMRFARVAKHALAGSHRPTLRGRDVSPGDYGAELLQGFTEMYHLLRRHRAALAAADGPLAAFADIETRFIARATQIYTILLEQSFHPDYLRNDADRERWFDQLESQAEEIPGLRPLAPAEREDLHRNDIPIFHSRPGSRDLWTSRGERIANFFERAPLESARERLADLGPDDLARQTWLIRTALAKLKHPARAPQDADVVATLPASIDRNEGLAAAIRTAEQLAAFAWQDSEEAGWLVVRRQERGWYIGALGLEMECGLPAIALFLAELDAATGQPRFASLVSKTLAAIHRRLLDTDAAEPPVGWQVWGIRLARATAMYGDEALRDRLEHLTRFPNMPLETRNTRPSMALS